MYILTFIYITHIHVCTYMYTHVKGLGDNLFIYFPICILHTAVRLKSTTAFPLRLRVCSRRRYETVHNSQLQNYPLIASCVGIMFESLVINSLFRFAKKSLP